MAFAPETIALGAGKPEQPDRERRRFAQLIEMLIGADQRLLCDILRQLGILEHGIGEGVYSHLEFFHQLAKGGMALVPPHFLPTSTLHEQVDLLHHFPPGSSVLFANASFSGQPTQTAYRLSPCLPVSL